MRDSLPISVRVLLVIAAIVSAGCNAADDRVRLSVFAASSLTESFLELEQEFERAHPEVDVQLSFAGSQVLRLQIEQGARADVFASANESHMAELVEARLVQPSQTFATNELVVIVPEDNPAALESFADLWRATRIVVGTESVPVGRYAREVIDRASSAYGGEFAAAVRAHVVSEEVNARLVRTKVELGEADAAIVYRTDAMASGSLRVIPIPPPINVRARYPIGIVVTQADSTRSIDFVQFVLGEQGRDVLRRHGFTMEEP